MIFWKGTSPDSSRGKGGLTLTTTLKLLWRSIRDGFDGFLANGGIGLELMFELMFCFANTLVLRLRENTKAGTILHDPRKYDTAECGTIDWRM